MHTYLQVSIFVILYLVGAFLIVFLSPSLFVSYISCVMACKRKSIPSRNPFVPGHFLLLLILTPFHLMSGSLMKRPIRTSWRTFHDKTFIRNVKSFYQTFLTLTYPLSSIVEVGSHHVAPRSHDLPWSYRSFTPICTDLITLYPSLSLAFRVYAW